MSTTIKKPFVELMSLLEANKDAKVSDILDLVTELAKSNKTTSTVLKNAKGEVTHIFCYYHKKWEEVKHFGVKKSHHTGLNTMCKLGVNQWTKQQRDLKKELSKVIDKVASGEIEVSAIKDTQEEIKLKYKEMIVPRSDNHGFDTTEEIK